MASPNRAVLEKNLVALRRTSGIAADAIASAGNADHLLIAQAPDGGLTGTISVNGATRRLASAVAPIDEGERLAGTVSIEDHACVFVVGYGLGHHVRALAKRMKRRGMVVCFEPDAALLRAAFEREDASSWLAESNVVILTRGDDLGLLGSSIQGMETLIGMGARILEHPASMPRIGAHAEGFARTVADLLRSIRMQLATTMVQVERTIENLLGNVSHYSTTGGVRPLMDTRRGLPAIVVAAGPSLKKNLHLLARPGVRDRFTLVAVQTVLRPMLDAGVKPHFVTALDYHESSRRFYEGLSAADVDGVTLIAEPKCHPAILAAYPGEIRCVRNDFLDEVIGPAARDMGEVRAGATVSHLAYYIARYLGCDPVILTGLDLGFTNHQYYAGGAAIHRVWAGELGPFNSLEMLEWHRIARMKPILRERTDPQGRRIFTDEQMQTYLAQFERDFHKDVKEGLRVIDATEGGVAKSHVQTMPLAQALDEFAPEASTSAKLAPSESRGVGKAEAGRRLFKRSDDAQRVREQAELALGRLREMLEHHDDQARVNRLIGEVERCRDKAMSYDIAYRLTHFLNQTGAFKRYKADRAIALADGLGPLEVQRRRIERDIQNIEWLRDASGRLSDMLRSAGESLDCKHPAAADGAPNVVAAARSSSGRRVAAMMVVDPEFNGLGLPRDLSEPFMFGLNPLRATLGRLARCRLLDRVVLIAEDVERARTLVGTPPDGLRIDYARADLSHQRARARRVGAARAWNPWAWRGGIGQLCVYDEALAAREMHRSLEATACDAALVVGCDWSLVDPEICDSVIEKFIEHADTRGTSFSQAPPGLAGMCVSRDVMHQLMEYEGQGRWFATLGATVGYVPVRPVIDQIADCARVSEQVRDLGLRCIPDDEKSRMALSSILGRALPNWMEAGADEIAAALAARSDRLLADGPMSLSIEICTGTRTGGVISMALTDSAEGVERPVMSLGDAISIIDDATSLRPGLALAIDGAGDPMMHPGLFEIIAHARSAGVGSLMVCTDLGSSDESVDRLLSSGVDAIVVNVVSNEQETYRRLTGVNRFDRVREQLRRLCDGSRTIGGLPSPWIVPRLFRCDAVLDETPEFCDEWTMRCGSAIVSPLGERLRGDRVEPLPMPQNLSPCFTRGAMSVLSSCEVSAGYPFARPDRIGRDIRKLGARDAWRACLVHTAQRRPQHPHRLLAG